jgi:hypothetical protein
MCEIRLSPAQRFFGLFAVRDIIIGFQDRKRPLSLVAQQRPSARHHHLGSIGLSVYEFAFPPAGTQQFRVNLIKRRREDSLAAD